MNIEQLIPLGPDYLLTTVDLFCGAGGVTTGVVDSKVAIVTHAINHSAEAIAAHEIDHPETIHLEEDIRNVEKTCSKLPKRINHLHASMECTSFSKAKGGQSRDADSRSLADFMELYVLHLNPDFFTWENVEEFKQWGPLIQKVKDGVLQFNKDGSPVMIPDPEHKGIWFDEWIQEIQDLGYTYAEAKINSADLGAYTSRVRLFGIFYREGMENKWPIQTHSKKGIDFKKWKPCRDILDFENKGNSIFGRSENEKIPKNVRRPLKPATHRRLAYGFNKFILPDIMETMFINKTYKQNGASGIEDPIHTIRTKDCHALVEVDKAFISKQYSTAPHKQPSNTADSVKNPLATITTTPGMALVQGDSNCVVNYNFGRENAVSHPDEPLNTIPTTNHISLANFVMRYFGQTRYHGMDVPLKSAMTSAKDYLVHAEKGFITQGIHKSLNASSLDAPVGTIMTQDEKIVITIQESTLSDLAKKEKTEFFKEYFPEDWEMLDLLIDDIKMRYLTSKELGVAQGFPEDAYLGRTETLRKHHIGNSVPPVVMEKWLQEIYFTNIGDQLKQAI